MSGNTKMAEQLATSKIGKQSALYTAAISCIQQTATLQQAGRLLASKFTAMNPWASELIGLVHIEQQALAYVRKRNEEMKHPRGRGQAIAVNPYHESSATAAGEIWNKRDIPGVSQTNRAGHDECANSGQRPNAQPETIGHNSGMKPTFDADRVSAAQAAIKGSTADSILRTLKFSDGRLAATMPLRELQCYKNDGILSRCLIGKIQAKFANDYLDDSKTAVDYLTEEEIADCADQARGIKLAEMAA